MSVGDTADGLHSRLMDLADDFLADPFDVDVKKSFYKILADEAAKYICDVIVLRLKLIYVLKGIVNIKTRC